MGELPRMTYATAMVLHALDRGHRYGFDIIDVAGVRSGTVYPLLRRLEEHGLVRSVWEDPEIARESGRPARKYYELTREAEPVLEAARERFPAVSHLPASEPAPTGGDRG